MELYFPTKRTKATADRDAIMINALADDVARMADVGDHLRRVFARLYHNRSYMRQWITKHCDFSVSSGLRYMVLSVKRQELRHAGIRVLADAYRALELDSNVSISLDSPLWSIVTSDPDVPPEADPGAQCSTKVYTTGN